jgi:hypothetical protein
MYGHGFKHVATSHFSPSLEMLSAPPRYCSRLAIYLRLAQKHKTSLRLVIVSFVRPEGLEPPTFSV